MKSLKRYTCFLLIAALLLATPVFAAEPRASDYFLSSSVYLHKTSGTTFEAWFEVNCLSIMDEVGASVVKIQRSSDGVNWTTMRTYNKESYTSMTDTNTSAHYSCVSYTGTAGYYYRAFIILYAKKGNGTGEVYRYTASIKL